MKSNFYQNIVVNKFRIVVSKLGMNFYSLIDEKF